MIRTLVCTLAALLLFGGRADAQKTTAEILQESSFQLLTYYDLNPSDVFSRMDLRAAKTAMAQCEINEPRIDCETTYPTSDPEVCRALAVFLPLSLAVPMYQEGHDQREIVISSEVMCEDVVAEWSNRPEPEMKVHRDGAILYQK